jgi:FSR family fosmidomycin resistance protein-like MFS transporter
MFRNRLFVAVSLGHMATDILNSLGPVLLAVLAVPLALSNARIGLALTLYTFAGSLSQPLFGWLADLAGPRSVALAGLGMLWMAACYAGMALAGDWALMLPLFLLASLGSGLFHPVGTASAAAAQRERAGSATAMFFFFGQAGLALGPVLGGLLFAGSGALGMLPLCLLAVAPAVLLLVTPAQPLVTHAPAGAAPQRARVAAMAVIAFVALVAVRSSIQAVYQGFLPKLFEDRGWSPVVYGALSGSFMLAAAVGNVATGSFADRHGMRLATVAPLVLSVPCGLLCLWAPSVPAAFVGAALAGLTVGGQHSVLVVHAQKLLPARQGFASGLILGFTFAAGGIGTWLAGIAGDPSALGLLPTMQIVTALALPCALLALTLPGRGAILAPDGVVKAQHPAPQRSR